MRKVIFESAISIDGFIEGPDGCMDWLVDGDYDHDPIGFLDSFDTIFYGRKAYEKFGVTPFLSSDIPPVEREFYYSIRAMRKYVFSRTSKHVAGNGMVISEDLEAEVRRIREEDGKDIWFCGGADILRTFTELDLVDEYILTVHPVLLKSGKPLFAGSKKPHSLKLIHKRKLESGVVVLHYQPENRSKI
jgi:dihydrofolate reductase